MEQLQLKQLVKSLMGREILISDDFLREEGVNKEEILTLISSKIKSDDFLVLNQDVRNALYNQEKVELNWQELERLRVSFEKGKPEGQYLKCVQVLKTTSEQDVEEEHVGTPHSVKVLKSFEPGDGKHDVQDFVDYFNVRYRSIEKLLRVRQELSNILSINRVLSKKDKETVSIIGIVSDKRVTKNNNLFLTLEDPTGQIKVLISKNRPDLFETAKQVVLDEVVGVVGVNGDKIVFANNLLWPEVPVQHELKKAPDEAYALFISDIHVGSNLFLEDEFNRFLKWINGQTGNEQQRAIANKVRYLFIVGDLVDGCGIYPGQEKELAIPDLKEQYKKCAELLTKIPKQIQVIVCPGNHDAIRLAEPQTTFYKDFAADLFTLPNVTIVSNPSLVNIHASDTFSGFDVLMYHGNSFDYFINRVDYLRQNGGYRRADLVMKFLLQRRHLAPTHGSVPYVPGVTEDPLIISQVPDFFITGHIHYTSAARYRNVNVVCCSCWQGKTSYQEKLGHEPQPARVPIVNLQTREIKVLKFGQ